MKEKETIIEEVELQLDPAPYLERMYELLPEDDYPVTTEEMLMIFEALSAYVVACCFEGDDQEAERAVETARKIYYFISLDDEEELLN